MSLVNNERDESSAERLLAQQLFELVVTREGFVPNLRVRDLRTDPY